MANHYTANYIELNDLLRFIKSYHKRYEQYPTARFLAEKYDVSIGTIYNKIKQLASLDKITIPTVKEKRKFIYKLK